MRRYDFGICGFGKVGRVLARHFAERRARLREQFEVDLNLTWVVDSSAAVFSCEGVDVEALAKLKEGGAGLATAPDARPIATPDTIRETGVEGIVIALPTDLEHGEPGLSLARKAIDCELDVILADKGPALFALPELEERAGRYGTYLGTSGTTGGALPSLDVLRRWFAASRVEEITGILNGTSNYILTRMRASTGNLAQALTEALAEAQAQGMTETDPVLDVEGFDAAIKLVILVRGLIDPRATLAQVDRRGLTELSEELVRAQSHGSGRVRLIARAVREGGRATMSVAPELLPPDDPLFFVDGAQKAIRICSDDLGAMTLVGGATGPLGTASALLRDLIAAALATR
jgi:homoserine dehydrogenase